jgi:hypothetical protein
LYIKDILKQKIQILSLEEEFGMSITKKGFGPEFINSSSGKSQRI